MSGEHNKRNGRTDKKDGIALKNPHIPNLKDDVLYHIYLSSGGKVSLEKMFGDVKFVCFGGTPKRMKDFAHYLLNELNVELPAGTMLEDISAPSNRYSMYKAGPVLSISHGMGMPSVSILLHEVIKLVYHAKCKDPIFIRIGTCGGIGIPPGSLVITEEAVDGLLRPYHELFILGDIVQRPAILDKEIGRELLNLAQECFPTYNSVMGKTMCTSDFYEGQGRLDGAFCNYTEEDKLSYLQMLMEHGVSNIEMESLVFGAICHHAGIKAAVVCVTLLNRLNGDQINSDKNTLEEYQMRVQKLVALFIKKRLELAS